MSFYKLINSNNNIFAVATNFDFMRYQPNHISAYCSVDKAEYVNVDGEYYRAGWMRPTVKETKPADIIEITEDEYNILYEALKTDEEIPQEEPPIAEDIPEEPTEDMSLEQVRTVKLNQLSKICN